MSPNRRIRYPRFDQTTRSIPVPEAPRPLLADWPLLVGLVLLWMCLWGSITPLTIVTGVVTAVLVVRVFELPHVVLSGRVHPGWALWFGLRFAVDVVAGSAQVAWQAVAAARPGGAPSSAIVATPLRIRNDLLLTLIAVTLSLIPGSIVVEVDRGRSILYLHVLGATSDARLDRFRRSVASAERRLVLAIGSAADVEQVR